MIAFLHRATYIRVIRLPGISEPIDDLGKLFRTMKNRGPGVIGRPEWIWDGCYRAIDYETIDHSDKRQIIGLLDNLNGMLYRKPEDMRTQWEKITGLAPAEAL